MAEKLSILVTAGHPADAFDAVGGTLAKHAERGDRVTVAVLTHGVKSHGWSLMAQERQKKASDTEADVEAQAEKECRLYAAIDALKERFGDQVVQRGVELKR